LTITLHWSVTAPSPRRRWWRLWPDRVRRGGRWVL